MPTDVLKMYHRWQETCVAPFFTQDRLQSVSESERNVLFFRYYARVTGVLFNGESGDCSTPPALLPNTALNVPENTTGWPNTLIRAVESYMASESVYKAQLDQMLRAAAAPVLSLEYDFNTPLNQPSTSTVKLIGSWSGLRKNCKKQTATDVRRINTDHQSATPETPPKKSSPCASSTNGTCINQLTGTINLGGSFYNSSPSAVPGAGAFRDAQLGVEGDWGICTSISNPVGSFLTNATIGVTYYYQDQVSPSILKVTPGAPVSGVTIAGLASTATSVFAKKGPINFVQLKYGLGTGKNVKFPIAVSWSNRTDLIVRPLWSAQFGVSYDFSSLFGSSNPSNTAGGSDGNSGP
jgi:hypothetical protein